MSTVTKAVTLAAVCLGLALAGPAFAVDAQDAKTAATRATQAAAQTAAQTARDARDVRTRAMIDAKSEQDRVSRDMERMNQSARGDIDRASDTLERAAGNVRKDLSNAGQDLRNDLDRVDSRLRAGFDRNAPATTNRSAAWDDDMDDADLIRNVQIRDPDDRAWAIERAKLSNQMTQSERRDLTRLENRRTDAQRDYFEKRREYRERLAKAPAGSSEERGIRKDLSDLNADYEKEMLKYQQELRDFETRNR